MTRYILLISMLVLLVPMARADAIFINPPPAFPLNYYSMQYTGSDDFILSSPNVVQWIIPRLYTPSGNPRDLLVTWSIRSDDNGHPGGILFSGSGISSYVFAGSQGENPAYDVSIATGSAYLDAGRYWLMLQGNVMWDVTNASTFTPQSGLVNSSPISGGFTFRLENSVVPEPSSFLLIASGLGGLGLAAWRRKN